MNRILRYLKSLVSGLVANVWGFAAIAAVSAISILVIEGIRNWPELAINVFIGLISCIVLFFIPIWVKRNFFTSKKDNIRDFLEDNCEYFEYIEDNCKHKESRETQIPPEGEYDVPSDFEGLRKRNRKNVYYYSTIPKESKVLYSGILMLFIIILGILAIPALISYWYFNPFEFSKRTIKVAIFIISLIALTINYFQQKEKYKTRGEKVAYFLSSIGPPSAVDIFM